MIIPTNKTPKEYAEILCNLRSQREIKYLITDAEKSIDDLEVFITEVEKQIT